MTAFLVMLAALFALAAIFRAVPETVPVFLVGVMYVAAAFVGFVGGLFFGVWFAPAYPTLPYGGYGLVVGVVAMVIARAARKVAR